MVQTGETIISDDNFLAQGKGGRLLIPALLLRTLEVEVESSLCDAPIQNDSKPSQGQVHGRTARIALPPLLVKRN